MSVKSIPEGYHTVTPYLVVDGVDGFIEFLAKAFRAQENFRHRGPDGKTGHAEMRLGDSMLMMGEARGNAKATTSTLYLYVADVDSMFQQAVAAGATVVAEPVDQFYGDRSGAVSDRWGNNWWIATHKEDVSPEEMARRVQAIKK